MERTKEQREREGRKYDDNTLETGKYVSVELSMTG